MLDLGDPSMTLAAGARRATMALLQGFAAQPRDDDLVRSEAVPVSYRKADEYLDGSRLVNGPVPEAFADEPFFVMKRQVLRMEYDRCVAAEACKALDGGTGRCASRRRTNNDDAVAYAASPSPRSGSSCRGCAGRAASPR